MAIIEPVGIDLATGQYKRVLGGDTIRPETGDLTISGGNIFVTPEAGFGLTAQESVFVTAGDSGTNGDVFIESKGSGYSITLQRNPGTPTTSVVLDDNGFTVNGNLYASNIGDSASNVNIETQSGDVGGDGTRLYITPNLGIILEIGNTIKIDPDGTNNWIYGDDGVTGGNGEPLTLRGGHGDAAGDGAALRLRGGDGGNTTGNGGNIELTPGTTTGGAAGTLAVGTTTADLLRFYGTAAGTAQQTVTGSRGGNAALADLLTRLAALGIIVDGTSA